MWHYSPYTKDRAQKRLWNEMVFGSKIKVASPTVVGEQTQRNYTPRRMKGAETRPSQQLCEDDLGSWYWCSESAKCNVDAFAPIENALKSRRPSDYFAGTVPADGYHEEACGLNVGKPKTCFREDDTHLPTGKGYTNRRRPVELRITNIDPTIEWRVVYNTIMGALQKRVAVSSLDIHYQQDGYPTASLQMISEQDAEYAISRLHRYKLGNQNLYVTFADDDETRDTKSTNSVDEFDFKPSNRFGTPTHDDHEPTVTYGDGRPKASSARDDDCQAKAGLRRRLVELKVTNIDPTIKWREVYNSIVGALKKHVAIASLNVQHQADGLRVARLQLYTKQDAQYVISRLHRYKLGKRKLYVAFAKEENLDKVELKKMIVSLLQEAPGNSMPLFKLIEILKNVYRVNASVHEINKLTDVICVNETAYSGRTVSLTASARDSPLGGGPSVSSMLYCSAHCPNGLENRGWGEMETTQLPCVMVPLRVFAYRTKALLAEHADMLPLQSFPICYEKIFGEPLPIEKSGVPLEHLVTCVSDIELRFGGPNRAIKYIVGVEEAPTGTESLDEGKKQQQHAVDSNTQQLCRELVDLMKTIDGCQLPLSKFIPAYHHQFGRQCRVSDFGYIKLIDLLQSQAISNVVQIIGEGSQRMITLTHKAQMRRFLSDMLKVLKAQPSKQFTGDEFPSLYEKLTGRPFSAIEYGVCALDDLLDEVSKERHAVAVTRANAKYTVSIPKTQQTPEQVLLAKQFANDVVKLLVHTSGHSMRFNNFVQAYHHHFGYQCRVNDYGFAKLIELFEAIPDTVRIEEMPNGERMVRLTPERALHVLGRQVVDIVKESALTLLPLDSLPRAYLKVYGHYLMPEAYGCDGLEEVIAKLSDYVQLQHAQEGPLLFLARPIYESVKTKDMRLWAILLNAPHSMDVENLVAAYKRKFNDDYIELRRYVTLLSKTATYDSSTNEVSLSSFYVLAAKIYHLIVNCGGRVTLNNLEGFYYMMYNQEIPYAQLQIKSLTELIDRLNFMVELRGPIKTISIILSENLAEYGIQLPYRNNGNDTSRSRLPPPRLLPENAFQRTKQTEPPKLETFCPFSKTSDTWQTPPKNPKYLQIQIPELSMPEIFRNPELVSPAKYLLPAHPESLSFYKWLGQSPDPMELPMPDKLLTKADESNDSGMIHSTAISESEMDCCSIITD